MSETNPILRALDKAVSVLTRGPQNQTNARPMDGEAGAIAKSINAAIPGRAGADMDNVRIVRPPPDKLANVPFPTPEQIAIFSERLSEYGYYDGPPSSLRDALAGLDERWVRVQTAITECVRSPMPKYQKHLADMSERIAAGGPADDVDSWSLDDWRSDQAEKLAALKGKAREIEAEAWKLAEPELARKSEAVTMLAQDVTVKEREHCEVWGFDCLPPWCLSLHKWAAILTDGSRKTVGKPSAMIEGI
jgi:hypothetical protein